jgi:ABC-type branched-subunit amino acid transport system ATPase component
MVFHATDQTAGMNGARWFQRREDYQGNRVFTDLTVHENLQMGGITLPGKQQLKEGMERVFSLFPGLKARL